MKQPSFFQRVYSLVRQIPAGACASYSQLAYLLGAPRAARQVGWAMRTCPDDLPWQRVVKADGSIAGGGYADLRRALLEAEGVPFLPDGRVDLRACQWQGPKESENQAKAPVRQSLRTRASIIFGPDLMSAATMARTVHGAMAAVTSAGVFSVTLLPDQILDNEDYNYD